MMRVRTTWQVPAIEKLASKPVLQITGYNRGLVGSDFIRLILTKLEDQVAEGVPRNGYTIFSDDSSTGDITLSPTGSGEWEIRWNGSNRASVMLLQRNTEMVDMNKTAATASGLYGFKKAVQRDADSCISKLTKRADSIARRIFSSDEEVVGFLQRHAKTGKSKSAKMLLESMKGIGPKLASKKEAGVSPKGMYGFKHKTAELGLNACNELRLAAGQIVADIHERRGDGFRDVYAYMQRHSKEGRCMYAGMLVACGPDMPETEVTATEDVAIMDKLATMTVRDWLGESGQ